MCLSQALSQPLARWCKSFEKFRNNSDKGPKKIRNTPENFPDKVQKMFGNRKTTPKNLRSHWRVGEKLLKT